MWLAVSWIIHGHAAAYVGSYKNLIKGSMHEMYGPMHLNLRSWNYCISTIPSAISYIWGDFNCIDTY